MKYSKTVIIFLLTAYSLQFTAINAQEGEFKLRSPASITYEEENVPTTGGIKNIPEFPKNKKLSSTAHRISANVAVLPVDTRLRLSVDSFVDAKKSKVGEYFKAHVLEDFYLPGEPPQLIVPKDSWVRGRISLIKRPNIISMAGKIGLHLYQLVTPLGEATTLDAELDVQQGIVNAQGLLDPMTNYKTKALEHTQALLESQTGKVISIATLGTPVIGTLLTGALVALFSEGDNISLGKGQELQIVLKRDIQLSLN